MEYGHISSFLERIKNLVSHGDETRLYIKDTISTQIGFTIDSEAITLDKGIIRVAVSPLVKNEIFMRKEKILLEINTYLTDKTYRDIV